MWLPSWSHAYLQHIPYGGDSCRQRQGSMEVTTLLTRQWGEILDVTTVDAISREGKSVLGL